MNDYDVVIVGGGMVGASFALALRATKLRTLLIEGVSPDSLTQPSFDERTTALGNGSRQIFESLGVWPEMECESAPIRSIHVSDAGRFGVARLEAEEQRVDAFGYVVPNRVIGRALWQALRASPGITLAVPAQVKDATPRDDGVELDVVIDGAEQKIRCSVAVAADGAGSVLRASAGIGATVEDYDQVAIVVNAATDRPHTGAAFERFTSSGPLAVLPTAGGGYTVVWAVRPERARQLLALSDEAFAAELLAAFGWRAGRWTRIGRRHMYPLALSRATETVSGRVVLIGNAAQALHPIAGQGFNLGLRDAFELASIIIDTPRGDIGGLRMLARYRAARAGDRRAGIAFTHGLVHLFGNDRAWLRGPRGLGMMLLDALPVAKRTFTRAMLFGLH
jgi:2-octaprenyl-6-methoxyphenol hydroxylase